MILTDERMQPAMKIEIFYGRIRGNVSTGKEDDTYMAMPVVRAAVSLGYVIDW